MLIREDVASELLIATRILAYTGALGSAFRLSARAGEVIYVNRRGASNATMTAEDIAAVWLTDGYVLRGDPPDSIERHLDAYRQDQTVRSAVCFDDSLLTAASPRDTALRCIRLARAELTSETDDQAWSAIETEARAGGAFIGLV